MSNTELQTEFGDFIFSRTILKAKVLLRNKCIQVVIWEMS